MLGSLFHIDARCLKRVREVRPDLKDMIENFGTVKWDAVRGKFLVHANTQFVEFYHAPSLEAFNRLDLKFKQGSWYTFTSVRVSFRTVTGCKMYSTTHTWEILPRYARRVQPLNPIYSEISRRNTTWCQTNACKHSGLLWLVVLRPFPDLWKNRSKAKCI